jgi:hypothetical protein
MGNTKIQRFYYFILAKSNKISAVLTISSINSWYGHVFLAVAEKYPKVFGKAIIHIGRVPMFFYLAHIYLIHTLALLAAKFSGYNWNDMISQKPLIPVINGYGFPLAIVYLTWLIIVSLLYPLCKWYDDYKSRHNKWWLSYL